MIDFGLEGKVAIVTGASRGLGRAAAVALAEQGASVLAVARSTQELEQLAADFPGLVASQTCDMQDRAAVAALPQSAIDRFGRLDVIVNNAGIAPAGAFLDQSESEWDRVLAVNITAPAVLARAAGKHMVAQGAGKIINIASTGNSRQGGLVSIPRPRELCCSLPGAGGGMGEQGRAGQRHCAGCVRDRCAKGRAGFR
jgi:2-deoxy-D-gluconate 3-dehydrogenase